MLEPGFGLAAWLRLVLGDAEHTARLYEPGATLRLDSGRAAQVVALCVSLPSLQFDSLS